MFIVAVLRLQSRAPEDMQPRVHYCWLLPRFHSRFKLLQLQVKALVSAKVNWHLNSQWAPSYLSVKSHGQYERALAPASAPVFFLFLTTILWAVVTGQP